MRSAFQVYIDKFDEYEVVLRLERDQLAGQLSPSGVRSGQLYAAWATPGNAKKDVVGEPEMVSLGLHTDGTIGERRLPEGVLTRFVCFILWTLGRGHASRLHLQILAGRWVRAQQMKRATSGVFDRLWHHISHGPAYGRLPFAVSCELLAACCWCPFYVADSRQESHGVVTCSDASMTGAGICYLAGLSRWGSRAVVGVPIDPGQRAAECLGLLALSDGIGGCKRALDLLGVIPGAFYASEIDRAAMRCVSATWPQVEHLGAIDQSRTRSGGPW